MRTFFEQGINNQSADDIINVGSESDLSGSDALSTTGTLGYVRGTGVYWHLDRASVAPLGPGVLPASKGGRWLLLGGGGPPGPSGTPIWRGNYSNVTTYSPGDAVTQGGSSYVANVTTTGNNPPGAEWDTLALAGTPGLPGLPGKTGMAAYGFNAPFIQPLVGASVDVTVVDPVNQSDSDAGIFYIGQRVNIDGAGQYTVIGFVGVAVTFVLDVAIILPGNPVTSNRVVIGMGKDGPPGPPGTGGATFQAYTNTYAELYNVNFVWVPLLSLPITIATAGDKALCRFAMSFRAHTIQGATNAQKVSYRIQVDGVTLISWSVSQATQGGLEWGMAILERLTAALAVGAHVVSVDWSTDASSGAAYRGSWNAVTPYVIGDVVADTSGGGVWAAIANNTNELPSTHPASWVADGATAVAQTELNDGGEFFGNGAALTVVEVAP